MLKVTIWNAHFEIYAQKVFTASAIRMIEEAIKFTNATAEFVGVIDYVFHASSLLVTKIISFPEISSNVCQFCTCDQKR